LDGDGQKKYRINKKIMLERPSITTVNFNSFGSYDSILEAMILFTFNCCPL